MRIFERWRLVWAFRLIIKISRSRSIRLTARVKGEHTFRLMQPWKVGWTLLRRIAFVECHDPNAALTLKNWFDNK